MHLEKILGNRACELGPVPMPGRLEPHLPLSLSVRPVPADSQIIVYLASQQLDRPQLSEGGAFLTGPIKLGPTSKNWCVALVTVGKASMPVKENNTKVCPHPRTHPSPVCPQSLMCGESPKQDQGGC